MSARDPRRWSDPASGAHPSLRALVAAGRAELPDAACIEQMARRAGGDFMPPQAQAAGGAGAAGTAWLATLGLVVVGLGAATFWSTGAPPLERQDARPEHAPRASQAAPMPARAPALEGSHSARVEAPAPAAEPVERDEAQRRVPAARRAISAAARDAVEELRLLDAAQAVLDSVPQRALAHASEHARRFPRGDYVQEREVIATEALLRLGRNRAAERRATRFVQRYPHSGYLLRVEQQRARARDALRD